MTLLGQTCTAAGERSKEAGIDLSAQQLLKRFDENECQSKFGYVGVKKTADFSFDKLQQFNIVIYG